MSDMENYTLRPIPGKELKTVMSFYQSYIGAPGCTWNQNYPNEEILQEDFLAGNLYGLYEGDKLIGSISVDSENYLDKLPCWQYKTNVKEIARVVISSNHQRQGSGTVLLEKLFALLKEHGTEAIHLLVSPNNERAIKLYSKFGFINRGLYFLYEHNFFAMEAKIGSIINVGVRR